MILGDSLERLRDLAGTKPTCWAYEKEWRCIHDTAGTLYGYEVRHLTGLYFGLRMEEAHRIVLGSLLEKTDTKLYEMVRHEEGYGVKAKRVGFRKPDYRCGG